MSKEFQDVVAGLSKLCPVNISRRTCRMHPSKWLTPKIGSLNSTTQEHGWFALATVRIIGGWVCKRNAPCCRYKRHQVRHSTYRGPHAVPDCRYFYNSPRFPGDHLKDVVPAGFPHISFFTFFISVGWTATRIYVLKPHKICKSVKKEECQNITHLSSEIPPPVGDKLM